MFYGSVNSLLFLILLIILKTRIDKFLEQIYRKLFYLFCWQQNKSWTGSNLSTYIQITIILFLISNNLPAKQIKHGSNQSKLFDRFIIRYFLEIIQLRDRFQNLTLLNWKWYFRGMKKIYFPFQVDRFISPVLFIISLFLLL